ncbi:hypothetical protein TBLA_0B08780 [Henningerozyma blattae CBS 6284]|uniref:CTLH domain-containing protein n=1 Tax=Henningerozyma blattae (strain ATCC 34711 / CBS 6284 / DSM 70876 / NBRC 10599 / NRRL Y-10934 / UCD 77-7) TaxID=1071380 RepID=I2GZZ2_HENB6|nr:hypothetical protein TBLA_0B08780 [Tetrapisispora blattae CBS 6284]CCH59694.1 hypothetical protein TBLA_0B08780 [Tetrapisispora blattae CBS 6284]
MPSKQSVKTGPHTKPDFNKLDYTYYTNKSFTRSEWNNYIALVSNLKLHHTDESYVQANNDFIHHRGGGHSLDNPLGNETTGEENTSVVNTNLKLLKLLLNYFIFHSMENASVKLAKELQIIESNSDIKQFDEFFKISIRFNIVKLIKLGKINQALLEINNHFGIQFLDILYSSSSPTSSIATDPSYANQNDDLHFKLLLLNLIEMIKEHHTQENSPDNTQFIMDLIHYAQTKLASKATMNQAYMKQLELVITLLLFPSPRDVLPTPLQNLYSIKLRSQIANLVNKKLLAFIYSNSHNNRNNKFINYKDLLLLNSNDLKYKNLSYSNILEQSTHHNHPPSSSSIDDSASEFHKNLSTDHLNPLKDTHPNLYTSNQSLNEDIDNNLSKRSHWNNTSKFIQSNSNPESQSEPKSLNAIDNDANLIQLVKIWAWCENELHQNDIGIPRINST